MSLKKKLIRQIEAAGPMTMADYMAACLHDPEFGYYHRGAGLGRDFITSPEISQVFGELIGLWIAHEWMALGKPDPFILVELGPGRGVLMADAMRAACTFAGFRDAVHLALLEVSPELKEEQKSRLKDWSPGHFDSLDTLPNGPMLIIANELLDCLPVRQFVRDGADWRERLVGEDGRGDLEVGLSEPVPLPDAFAVGDTVQEVEIQPALDGWIAAIAQRLKADMGRVLFIDYGPANRVPSDSVRAYFNGQQIDPLSQPGASDLTADVDFSRLVRLAQAEGLSASAVEPQGGWLMRLGVQSRLDVLVKANPAQADALFAGVQRLVDPADMGERFKVVCLSSEGLPPAAGFSS